MLFAFTSAAYIQVQTRINCKQGFQYAPATQCSSLNSLKALIDQNKKKNPKKII